MRYCDNGWGLAPPGWAGKRGPLDPASVMRYCCTATVGSDPTTAPCSHVAEDSFFINTGCAVGGGQQPLVCCFIVNPGLMSDCTENGTKREPTGGSCRGDDH